MNTYSYNDVLRAVLDVTGFTIDDLKSTIRSADLGAARRALYILLKDELGWSNKKIAQHCCRTSGRISNLIMRNGSCHYSNDETIRRQDIIENRCRAALRQYCQNSNKGTDDGSVPVIQAAEKHGALPN